jgi:hypothetical protein
LITLVCLIAVASCSKPTYASSVHPHGELALDGYISKGVQPTLISGFFVRYISMHSHVMAKLWRDAFERAGNLLSLSSNPLQLCHLNYLDVIGKAPKSKGAHSHA